MMAYLFVTYSTYLLIAARSDEQLIQALSKYRLAGGKRAIVVIPGDDDVCSRLEQMAAAGYDDAVVFPKCYSHKTLTRIRKVIS